MKRSTKAGRKTALRMVHRNDRGGPCGAFDVCRRRATGTADAGIGHHAKAALESVPGHTSGELIELLLRGAVMRAAYQAPQAKDGIARILCYLI